MQKMYSEADLYSLFNSLKKYNDAEEIIKFFNELDLWNEKAGTEITLSDYKNNQQLLKSIGGFLLTTLVNYYRDISNNSLLDVVNNIIPSLDTTFQIGEVYYRLIDDEVINKVISQDIVKTSGTKN